MNATLTSTLRVYDENDASTPVIDTTDRAEIARILNAEGIVFERWEASVPLAADATQDEILAAYAHEIDRLKQQYGYTTVDVIRVTPETPNVPALRQKFLNEHTHSEDEVRFFVEGAAAFYLRLERQSPPDDLHARRPALGPGRDDALVRHGPGAAVRCDPSVRRPVGLGRAVHRRRHRHTLSEVRVGPFRSRRTRRSSRGRSCSTSKGRRARSRSSTRCSSRTRTSTSTRTSPRIATNPASPKRCARPRGSPDSRRMRRTPRCWRTCTSGSRTIGKSRRSRRCRV